MSETTKINQLRDINYFNTFFSGTVLDIGAGDDPVVDKATIFEREDGDANNILEYIKSTFNTVYTSNLLEHLENPLKSVKDFEALVSEDGYLIIVLPIFEYYEQGLFPSIFNNDHKFGFSYYYGCKKNYLININELINSLKFSKLVMFEANLNNYNKNLIFKNFLNLNTYQLRKISRISYEVNKRINIKILKKFLLYFLTKLNIPFDQSSGDSLCSMTLIFKKCIKL